MSTGEDATRCIAMTRAGNRCKNPAATGLAYCHIHRPANIALPGGDHPQGSASDDQLSDEQLRRQLMSELDELVKRVRAISPGYEAPTSLAQGTDDAKGDQAAAGSPVAERGILGRLRKSINKELLDAETWKGMWYMVNYTLEYQGDIVRRRFKGEYETDEWGLDWEFLEAVRPFLDFMYKLYWRVETTGIENIPDYDRALLVSNHSGQLPWDGAMIMTAVLNEHPAQRLTRNLYSDWFPMLPFLSSALVKMGQALASVDNGMRLLEQDELVCVFPEGNKGAGKLFKDRYKLARFGRGGFVKMAIRTGAPIIPVAVVGAEETYISLAKSSTLAKYSGFPYFPISPRFPWLGPLGAIPWPTKWYIDFGEAIPMDDYEPEAANNMVLVSQLTDQVRNIVQEMVDIRLSQRESILY